MINFANNNEPNNDENNQNKQLFNIAKVKDLLKAVFNKSGYYAGSFHESVTLVDLIDITDTVLFQEDKDSIHLIIDKNTNNSLDITIDKVE